MPAIPIIVNILAGIIKYLQDKRAANTLSDAFDMVEAVNNWVGRTITAIALYDGQEQGAVQYSAQYAKQIGHDFEQVQGTHERYWNRLITTILPSSFSHAYHVTQQWAIDYFSPPITDLYNHVQNLIDRTGTLESWRNGWVDPHIATFANFLTEFYRGDQPAINVLNDWLAKPGDFGQWAAYPILGPIVAYLAYPEHTDYRDSLALTMVDAWQEVPNPVWEGILRFMVTTK